MIANERVQYIIASRIYEMAYRSDCGLIIITLDRSLKSLLRHHPDEKYGVYRAKNPFLVTFGRVKESQLNPRHLTLAKKP